MTRIVSIGMATPDYRVDTPKLKTFMDLAYRHDRTAARKMRLLMEMGGIETRYSCLPDFSNPEIEGGFYQIQQAFPVSPTMVQRMQEFKSSAVELSVKAIYNALDNLNTSLHHHTFTHLITVSCTGVCAPGLDAMLVTRLNLPVNTVRSAINFMGCNAAFLALREADNIVRSHLNALVLIVCTELCTLHFNAGNSNDQLLSNSLFGDGSAVAIVCSEQKAEQEEWSGLSMGPYFSELVVEGASLMSWNLQMHGFEMELSAELPTAVETHLPRLLSKLKALHAHSPAHEWRWAVHPGGKRILDAACKALGLQPDELAPSFEVLRKYGNLSSATILVVLSNWMEDLQKANASTQPIMALGFGPGLTIDTFMLTPVKHRTYVSDSLVRSGIA